MSLQGKYSNNYGTASGLLENPWAWTANSSAAELL
ncbi:hypothetical protein LSH36_55g00016 [Paralvinella palmiformis]|uniref:Uncharacterized protein n=1 Tax=Paralvinella palmiformis TaxID=53620 RepID=A0AAD9K4Z8_9ANNE|nr:hypothetical protein LSH36_55g00016 [Paralvinella palmiformis]